MDNPYASPSPVPYVGGSSNKSSGRPRELVDNVRVLAVAMIFQGALDILMGCIGIGAGVSIVRSDPDPSLKSPDHLRWVFVFTYYGLVFVAGILNAYSGWQSYRFKARTLGIVSLCAGLVTVPIWFLNAPTSLALLVFGLIVYRNPVVKEAFDLGRRGYTPEQIAAAFDSPAGHRNLRTRLAACWPWLVGGFSGGLVAGVVFCAALVGMQQLITARTYNADLGSVFATLTGFVFSLVYGILGGVFGVCRPTIGVWAVFIALAIVIAIPLLYVCLIAGRIEVISPLTVVIAAGWVVSLSAAISAGIVVRNNLRR